MARKPPRKPRGYQTPNFMSAVRPMTGRWGRKLGTFGPASVVRRVSVEEYMKEVGDGSNTDQRA